VTHPAELSMSKTLELAAVRNRYPVEPTIDEALTRRLAVRAKAGGHYSSPSLDEIRKRLGSFIASQVDGPIEIRDLHPLTGGASKEQFVFALDWTHEGEQRVGEKMVLRCEPAASIVETSRLREYELMRFGAKLMPVPKVYFLDADGSSMGTPSLVSAFVGGVQKPAKAASNVTGMGVHFPEEYRSALVPQYAGFMAALHRATPDPSTLPSFVIPQVGSTEAANLIINWWARTWHEDRFEDVPIATMTEQWLRRNAPVLDHASVVHGDFRTGNFLFNEARREITAILDWELGYVGDRHGDLAWVLSDLYVTRENGKPYHCGLFESDDALVDAYLAAGGLPIDRKTLAWHKIFCTWKQLVLSLGCALRAGDGLTHQDVLLTWLSACGYTLSESLRRLLEQEG
jgi:aminoglycoside phosphotransferase (APT) family kinase protein